MMKILQQARQPVEKCVAGVPESRVLVAQMQLIDGAGRMLFVNPLVVLGFNPQSEPPP